MKFSHAAFVLLAGVAAAAPATSSSTSNALRQQARQRRANGGSGSDLIAQLQATFDRNNPNGTPTTAGDPDDLNGDGVINDDEPSKKMSDEEKASVDDDTGDGRRGKGRVKGKGRAKSSRKGQGTPRLKDGDNHRPDRAEESAAVAYQQDGMRPGSGTGFTELLEFYEIRCDE
ncbi:hypothetical protein CMUS01_06992 [Colletotrichum musicola]|uniref:Uncharacterized protein n=1 Tax=Colletotrichum musicola TaxID=2175873 RepID=A0A8H6KIT0_9PEZI|nr:hypothetical protein CMUS01_06992 [Colletotrichum musicola]